MPNPHHVRDKQLHHRAGSLFCLPANGRAFRQAVEKAGAETIVPPPRDGVVRDETTDPATKKRNDAIQEIKGLGGDDHARKIWKVLKNYHRRSLAETMMYRIKQLTGANLRHREWGRQQTESCVKCLVINMMTRLGMPKGKWEEAA